MNARLKSITLSDFRSIRGTITVPLDASVILIHGANGSGKTSLVSGLELACTGEILSMRRTEPNYRAYLTHRGADHGRVLVTAGDERLEVSTHETSLEGTGVVGAPMLIGDDARFFAERCYLAQATLGRLLEIYQNTEASNDSALTRFVKDLLGLDALDSIIAGLHTSHDLRNTRRVVPEIRDAEIETEEIDSQLDKAKKALEKANTDAAAHRSVVQKALVELGIAPNLGPADPIPKQAGEMLDGNDEQSELVGIAGYRRDLTSIQARWTPIAQGPEGPDQVAAESEAAAARFAVDAWQSTTGLRLEALIDDMRPLMPDLPSVAASGPGEAYATVAGRVTAELDRCNRAVAEDDAAGKLLEDLLQSAEQNRVRIGVIDEQIREIAADADSLSQALAAVLPHIHTEDCPVCGRDFSETSTVPLVEHVSSRVARLSEQAGRIQELTKSRLATAGELTQTERQRDATAARRLDGAARGALKERTADIAEAKRKLDDLAESVAVGAASIRAQAGADRRLAEIRSRSRVATELREAVSDLSASLREASVDPIEPLTEVIDRLGAHLVARSQVLESRLKLRQEAIESRDALDRSDAVIAKLTTQIRSDTARRGGLVAARDEAERRRQLARSLAHSAVEVRSAVVGQVFSASLNKIWRDLFVRLAPSEPYVPAFRLPKAPGEAVTAELETVHRSGDRGGAPSAMLSSGNLNTAALTLFLALHLSVEPRLPWLILDDPVQSMDEVHIAQFAALLRTLSKEHGRQVVLAVHERPLFDYLTLELSPAFEEDRLITVELTASENATTVAEPTYYDWAPDPAVAA